MTSADFYVPRVVNSDPDIMAPAEDETSPDKSNLEPQILGKVITVWKIWLLCGFTESMPRMPSPEGGQPCEL